MPTYIDPPSGWKYGFPKPLPDNMDDKAITEWLVENGYPQSEIDACGKYFHVRIFEEEEK